ESRKGMAGLARGRGARRWARHCRCRRSGLRGLLRSDRLDGRRYAVGRDPRAGGSRADRGGRARVPAAPRRLHQPQPRRCRAARGRRAALCALRLPLCPRRRARDRAHGEGAPLRHPGDVHRLCMGLQRRARRLRDLCRTVEPRHTSRRGLALRLCGELAEPPGRDQRGLDRRRRAALGRGGARARARARRDARAGRRARLPRHAERAAAAGARRQARGRAAAFRAGDRALRRARSVREGRICAPVRSSGVRSGAARSAAARGARGAHGRARPHAVQRVGQGGGGPAARDLGGLLLMGEARIAAGLRGLSIWLVGLFAVALPAVGAELKVATIAPDGSHWMREMRAAAAEIKERTGGSVEIRFYPGGVMGNDAQVLRKIRIGQLHGGAFTAGGLAERYSALNLYGIPLLFRSLDEVDYVREHLDPVLTAGLEEAGFVGFGFIEGGFARLMANHPVRGIEDMRRRKVWVPEGDPISFFAMEELGLSPVVLPVTDVLTGLQTGLLDIVA